MDASSADRRAEWHRYYSRKRIVHQCRQIELLRGLNAHRVIEIGPYMGFVTALLTNAGYDVTTVDIFPQAFEHPKVGHIETDLRALHPRQMPKVDAIICCETLEHLWWNEAARALAVLNASGARYLVLSVPYSGVQFAFSAYINAFAFSKNTATKLRNWLRNFKVEADPLGHKWEVGYRGHSLRSYEQMIRAAGWQIRKRDFTGTTRSVFHLCERADHRA